MSSAPPLSKSSRRLAWISPGDDPAQYQAVEEACLRDSNSDFLILWINRPSVFVGKNQNLWAQVSAAEALHTGIPLNRRLSGGGTVYHDPGNLNFSLISSGEAKIAFRAHFEFVQPYFEARNLAVEVRNRSDLFLGDRKISGNAEYFSGGRILHHGTLLFDSDLAQLGRLLTPDSHSYADRSIDSNRSPTLNLREHLPHLPDTRSFAEDLLAALLRHHPGLRRVAELPDRLSERSRKYLPRFTDPGWLYGRSPRYELSRQTRSGEREIRCRLRVEEGRICELAIHTTPGEAALQKECDALCKQLIGEYHAPDAVASILRDPSYEVGPKKLLSGVWPTLFF